jgi:hypothetical protein
MGAMARLYSRTEAGRRAWDLQDARLPIEYRRVLGLVGNKTDAQFLVRKLGWSEDAVNDALEELEGRGMVESIAPDLDFTGSLLLDELDFTGSLGIAELRAAQQKKND